MVGEPAVSVCSDFLTSHEHIVKFTFFKCANTFQYTITVNCLQLVILSTLMKVHDKKAIEFLVTFGYYSPLRGCQNMDQGPMPQV